MITGPYDSAEEKKDWEHYYQTLLQGNEEETVTLQQNFRSLHGEKRFRILSNLQNFIQLIEKDDDIALNHFLAQHEIDINQNFEDNITGLIAAMLYRNTKVVPVLLKHGANPNVKSHRLYTPLSLAISDGNIDIVEMLLGYGANIEETSSLVKNTPLLQATEKNHLEIVRLLLKKNANTNARNSFSQTPLFIAIFEGYDRILRLLLEYGVDVEDIGSSHSSAIGIAILNGRTQALTRLLAHGVNTNIRSQDGKTPLIQAVIQRKADAIPLLLNNGADIRLSDNDGTTALMWAVKCNDLNILDVLLKSQTQEELNILFNQTDKQHCNAMMLASHMNHEDIVTMLQKYGAQLPECHIVRQLLKNAIKGKDSAALNRLLKSKPNVDHFFKSVEKIFADVFDLILKEFNRAKEHNKPLMLLIGESHSAEVDALVEVIIIYIAKRHLKINKIFTETPEGSCPVSSGFTEIYLHQLIQDLSLTRVNLENIGDTDRLSMEIAIRKIKERNTKMATRALQSEAENCIFVTGGLHVYGLLNQTSLSEVFYIKPFNLVSKEVIKIESWSYSDVEIAKEYLLSEEHCYQLQQAKYVEYGAFSQNDMFIPREDLIKHIPFLCDLVEPLLFSSVGSNHMKRGITTDASTGLPKKKGKWLENTWNPAEIWATILSHLPLSDFSNAIQVSWQWHGLVQKLSRQWLTSYTPHLERHRDFHKHHVDNTTSTTEDYCNSLMFAYNRQTDDPFPAFAQPPREEEINSDEQSLSLSIG